MHKGMPPPPPPAEFCLFVFAYVRFACGPVWIECMCRKTLSSLFSLGAWVLSPPDIYAVGAARCPVYIYRAAQRDGTLESKLRYVYTLNLFVRNCGAADAKN